MMTAVGCGARGAIVLGFDVGKTKTGLALGNRISGGARPLGIVRGDRAAQVAAIAATVREWQPGMLVVGLPVHIDGAAHRMTERARRFGDALGAAFALPVAFADERRSTQLARQTAGGGEVDDRAAAIILQQWLDCPQPPAVAV